MYMISYRVIHFRHSPYSIYVFVIDSCFFFERRCKGVHSIGSMSLFPLQFPFTLLAQAWITLSACEFFWNSWTFGFSFTRPRCLWSPKNFSRGSCVMRRLRNGGAPGILSRVWISSMKLLTIRRNVPNEFMWKYYYIILLVSLSPVKVSVLRSNDFFCAAVRSFLFSTAVSHSSK